MTKLEGGASRGDEMGWFLECPNTKYSIKYVIDFSFGSINAHIKIMTPFIPEKNASPETENSQEFDPFEPSEQKNSNSNNWYPISGGWMPYQTDDDTTDKPKGNGGLPKTNEGYPSPSSGLTPAVRKIQTWLPDANSKNALNQALGNDGNAPQMYAARPAGSGINNGVRSADETQSITMSDGNARRATPGGNLPATPQQNPAGQNTNSGSFNPSNQPMHQPGAPVSPGVNTGSNSNIPQGHLQSSGANGSKPGLGKRLANDAAGFGLGLLGDVEGVARIPFVVGQGIIDRNPDTVRGAFTSAMVPKWGWYSGPGWGRETAGMLGIKPLDTPTDKAAFVHDENYWNVQQAYRDGDPKMKNKTKYDQGIKDADWTLRKNAATGDAGPLENIYRWGLDKMFEKKSNNPNEGMQNYVPKAFPNAYHNQSEIPPAYRQ